MFQHQQNIRDLFTCSRVHSKEGIPAFYHVELLVGGCKVQWCACSVVLRDEVGVCFHDLVQKFWLSQPRAAVKLNRLVPRLWGVSPTACHVSARHLGFAGFCPPNLVTFCSLSASLMASSNMHTLHLQCCMVIVNTSAASDEVMRNVDKGDCGGKYPDQPRRAMGSFRLLLL